MRISQNQYACVGFHGKATLHSSAKLIKTAGTARALGVAHDSQAAQHANA
jgi:hypothetical protein